MKKQNEMATPRRILEIDQIGPMTLIKNSSGCHLFISIRPTPPKKKYIRFILVPDESFVLHEEGIDITKISIEFDEKTPVKAGANN